MAYEESLKSISLEADSSIGIYTGVPGQPGSTSPNNGKQFRFVKVTGANTAGICSTASNEIACGVLQNKPQQVGSAATVAISGVSMMEAGALINAAAGVKIDNTGRPVPWVGGTDDVDLRKGVALLAAGAAGDLIPVLLQVN